MGSSFESVYQVYLAHKDAKDFASNETQVSNSLVGPFLRDALGWNINDPDEVKYESHVATRRADIIISIDGISQFVVEVKSIVRPVFDNVEFYKQAIQYADNLERRFAILTNFEQFVILRTDLEPKNENWLTLEVDRYEIETLRNDLSLLSLFSKSVWIKDPNERDKNIAPLDTKFQETYRRRKPLDNRLTELFVKWRSSCLSWLKKEKPKLFEGRTVESVEEEVQRYLDRIIFITACEDKNIEDTRLRQYIPKYQSTLRIDDHFVTRGIKDIFEHYYLRYDSDLFDKGLADQFQFNDGVTYEILSDIKTPKDEIPYDFNTITLDILGKAYENFIGHLIRGRKNIEEVTDFVERKQEGIYYTPAPIVSQIVSRTVGTYVNGMSYAQLLDVKILDPACGSGTFLVSAYRTILNQAQMSLGRELTYEEKVKLFLSCIFGVDKDDRACDIAKLNVSLLLAEKNRKLPSLSDNIQVGDSLVPRHVDGYPKGKRWAERFPEVFDRSKKGFDIVIGNPPYLSTKDFENSTKYEGILRAQWGDLKDMYYLFIQLIDKVLISEGSTWGFIVPNTFFTLTNYFELRQMLRQRYNTQIIDLSPNVFKEAYVFNAIIIAQRCSKPQEIVRMGYMQHELAGKVSFQPLSYGEIVNFVKMPLFMPTVAYSKFDKPILYKAGELAKVFKDALSNSKKYQKKKSLVKEHFNSLKPGEISLLGLLCEGSQGLVTGNNSKYLGILPSSEDEKQEIWDRLNEQISRLSRGHAPPNYSARNTKILYNKAEQLKAKHGVTALGKKFLYKTIGKDDIRKYTQLSEAEKADGIMDGSKKWIQYFRGNEEGDTWKVRELEYICWSHNYVKELKEAEETNSRWQGESFFFKPGFGWVDYFDKRIKGFFVEPTVYSKNVVKFHSNFLPDEYILGLLNSSYISYFVKNYITNTRTLQINDGKLIPIVISDKSITEEVVSLVKRIISLKDEAYNSRNDNDRNRAEREILAKESELDDIVFRIYGFDLKEDKDIIGRIRRN